MEGLTSIAVSGTYESFVICQPPTISWFSSAHNKQKSVIIQPAAHKNQQSANRGQTPKTLERNFCPRSMPSTKNTHRCPSQQEEGGPSGKWTQQQEVDIDLISSHSSPPASRRNSLLHSNSRGSSRDSSRLTPPRPTCENSTSIPRSIGQEVRIRDPCLREV